MTETNPASLFAADFLRAQKAMGNVTKDATNPHLKNKYATLTAALEVIRPALNDNNLFLLQPCTFTEVDGKFCLRVTTRVVHTVGYLEEFTSLFPCKFPMTSQEEGSAISYGRRYALMAIFSLGTEDDDGNESSGRKSQRGSTVTPVNTEADKKAVWVKAIQAAGADKEKLAKATDKVKAAGFSPAAEAELLALIAKQGGG